jgi:outer membrane protein assembly factor BamA
MKSSDWRRWGGLLSWHSLPESRLQSGVDSIRSWYPKHDHLLAKVNLVRLDYHPSTNTMTPVLDIESGPPPKLIPLLSQLVRVGFLSTSLLQDRRDGPLDANRGMYNSPDLVLASLVFGSQTGYGRLMARNSTYHPFNKNLVMARSRGSI